MFFANSKNLWYMLKTIKEINSLQLFCSMQLKGPKVFAGPPLQAESEHKLIVKVLELQAQPPDSVEAGGGKRKRPGRGRGRERDVYISVREKLSKHWREKDR
jgi:hypothetical protein